MCVRKPKICQKALIHDYTNDKNNVNYRLCNASTGKAEGKT